MSAGEKSIEWSDMAFLPHGYYNDIIRMPVDCQGQSHLHLYMLETTGKEAQLLGLVNPFQSPDFIPVLV